MAAYKKAFGIINYTPIVGKYEVNFKKDALFNALGIISPPPSNESTFPQAGHPSLNKRPSTSSLNTDLRDQSSFKRPRPVVLDEGFATRNVQQLLSEETKQARPAPAPSSFLTSFGARISPANNTDNTRQEPLLSDLADHCAFFRKELASFDFTPVDTVTGERTRIYTIPNKHMGLFKDRLEKITKLKIIRVQLGLVAYHLIRGQDAYEISFKESPLFDNVDNEPQLQTTIDLSKDAQEDSDAEKKEIEDFINQTLKQFPETEASSLDNIELSPEEVEQLCKTWGITP